MYVIAVIPLTRGSSLESLTYYAPQQYPVGTIIDIPIRKQLKRGVVLSCQPVSATKTAVRTATFTLRKLPEQPNLGSLPPALIDTAKKLTETIPAALGSILFALLPPEVRDGDVALAPHEPHVNDFDTPLVSVLQGTREERFRTYRSRVREAFAHRGSVLLVVPTSRDIDAVVDVLETGIENRIVTFSPLHTKKKMAAAYEALQDLSKAKLIITTASHAFVDRHDITSVIVEQSGSRYYKARTRPYLDLKDALVAMARVTNRSVLLGDLLPRTEDEYRRREDFFATEGETPKRISLGAKLEIVEQKVDRSASDTWRLFSPQLVDELIATHKSKRRSFYLCR